MTDAKDAAPPPAPPGIPALLEGSLAALVKGRLGYEQAGERPAPSYGASAAVALIYALAGLGLNAAQAALTDPATLGRYPAWLYGAVLAAALVLAGAALLALSALLFGLGRALGSPEGFRRAFQAAAMLFALAPVQALANAFPLAWTLPSALGAWAFAGALSGLLRAPFLSALAAGVALGGLSIGAQATARAAYEKARREAAAVSAAMAAATATAAASAVPALGEGEAAGVEALPSPDGRSGLDLLRAPSLGAPAAAPARPPEQVLLERGDAMRESASAMIGAALPMLEDPNLTSRLPAESKGDLARLKSLLAKMKAQNASAKPVSAAEQQALLGEIQAVSMRLMTAAMGSGALPGAAPAAPRRREQGRPR